MRVWDKKRQHARKPDNQAIACLSAAMGLMEVRKEMLYYDGEDAVDAFQGSRLDLAGNAPFNAEAL